MNGKEKVETLLGANDNARDTQDDKQKYSQWIGLACCCIHAGSGLIHTGPIGSWCCTWILDHGYAASVWAGEAAYVLRAGAVETGVVAGLEDEDYAQDNY